MEDDELVCGVGFAQAPASLSDHRLLEKADLQAVLSERYQADKYELQRTHEFR